MINMLQNRKGITPVIAIVLLLLVTVGEVGVVYTQFQNIAQQGNTEFDTKARQTEISITSVSENSDGDMKLVITNKQGSPSINTSKMLSALYYPDGADSQAAVPYSALPVQNVQNSTNSLTGTTCFGDGQPGTIMDPGDSYSCDTNVEWPSATESVGIRIDVQGGDKSWSKGCAPKTSSSATC